MILPLGNNNTSDSERYTFTGKERDAETGYSYFGVRYLDHELIPSWLSVDPMADKYPDISPYAYCAWNPIKLVDPNGEEVIIAGDKIESILSKLVFNHINIRYDDETGKLSVALNNCELGDLDKDERLLYDAIVSTDVRVQLLSFTSFQHEGLACFTNPTDKKTYKTEGGSFIEGRLLKGENGKVMARTLSFVDVDLLDGHGYDNGIQHEITEGYLIGKAMLEQNVQHVGMAVQNGNNPIVKEAHFNAISEKKRNK